MVGILKSAQEQISLQKSVQDNSTVSSTYEFGGKITSVSLYGKDNEAISLKNGSRINITLGLLYKVRSVLFYFINFYRYLFETD